jgi:chromosome segregation ATPase
VDQINELRETVNGLNEINRKIYDDNRKYQERQVEQRKQIDQLHAITIELKQVNECHVEKLACYEKELKEKELKLKSYVDKEVYLNESLQMIKYKLNDLKDSKLNLENDLHTLKSKYLHDDFIQKLKLHLHVEFKKQKKEIETLKSDRLKVETKNNELTKQLNDIELKLEEIIQEKEKTCETNRELNNELNKNNTKINELNDKLEFYYLKCNDLEKEIAEAQENHMRDTDEWKKFQADLQVAVRVANDFMNESEEKMNKMKDDYLKCKEREQSLLDEIEKYKKRLMLIESKQIYAAKQLNKGFY